MAQTTRKSKGTLVLRESVEQVWLAGLGALALTEEEGSKLFKTLVKRGEGFERTAKKQLQKAVATAKEAPGTALTRIEQGLDDTTAFPAFSAQLADEYADNNVKVVYKTYPGVSHGGIVNAGRADATAFIKDRL